MYIIYNLYTIYIVYKRSFIKYISLNKLYFFTYLEVLDHYIIILVNYFYVDSETQMTYEK